MTVNWKRFVAWKMTYWQDGRPHSGAFTIEHDNDRCSETISYMQMGFHRKGKATLWLRIPTFWDGVKNRWTVDVKTPKSGKLITATGKDSFELETNFNREIAPIFESDIADEVLNMFQPKEYW